MCKPEENGKAAKLLNITGKIKYLSTTLSITVAKLFSLVTANVLQTPNVLLPSYGPENAKKNIAVRYVKAHCVSL